MPSAGGGVARERGAALAVFLAALRLGLTSFGGPIAHVGYFRREYVERRRWLAERDFADLLALAQVLPGPASSQLGFAIGLRRAGLLGGLLAWVRFTLPSAVLMIAFAAVVGDVDTAGAGWVAGLKIAAVAVVAQAVWAMARALTPDLPRIVLALAAAAAILAVDEAACRSRVIAAGAVAGRVLGLGGGAPRSRPPDAPASAGARRWPRWRCSPCSSSGCRVIDRRRTPTPWRMGDAYYRSGALVFGGGHVVLPLLEERVVTPGLGLARGLPGRLRRGAGGARAAVHLRRLPRRRAGAGAERRRGRRAGARGRIFLPALLLVVGVAPFWDALRGHPAAFSAPAPASTPRWSASCWPRSTTPSARRPSTAPRPPCWRWRRWRGWSSRGCRRSWWSPRPPWQAISSSEAPVPIHTR